MNQLPSSDTPAAGQPKSLSRKQMEKAFAHHQAGRLKEAEGYYRQVLRLDPEEADANNLLGVLLFQTNRAEDGLKFLATATRVRPTEPMFFYNEAVALRAAGKIDEAIQAFSRCVELDAKQSTAMTALVELLFKRKQHAQAVGVLKRLVTLKPMEAKGFKRLGEALHAIKQHAEAATAFRRACDLSPDDAPLLHQLGLCLQALGDKDGAINVYQQCLQMKPELAAAHNNLAILLADKGEFELAVKEYELALKHDGKLFQTRCNLGGLLRKMGRLDDSIACLEEAVRLRSDCAEAWCNLGNSLGDAGRAAEAMKCYRNALLCKPDYPQARLNRSLGLLRLEDFEHGWAEYEWRSKLKECPRRHTSRPRWCGEIEAGKRILVHVEQGLGDTFQMIRYAKWLRSQGMHVILECQKPLMKIMSDNDVADELFAMGTKTPEFDMQIPLMSMPSVLWDQLGFAASEPYLVANEKLVAAWGERLGPRTAPRVGIAWQGNPDFKQDQFRSVALKEFAPLFEVEPLSFYSLQKSHGVEQLKDFQFADQITQFDDLDEQAGAFMDTAAVMSQLDLVVTSDSAVAHLAGALGIRTCLLLPFASDWRWFAGRWDCPWYPNVRMYRQADRGDWQSVLASVAAELPSLTQVMEPTT